MRIAILSQLWPDALRQLQQRYDCVVEINPEPEPKLRLLHDAEVVVLAVRVILDRATIEHAARLRLVVRAGAGSDNIDLTVASDALHSDRLRAALCSVGR